MNTPDSYAFPQCYIDIRPYRTSQHISLDIARHLPRRAIVGPVAIVTDEPLILLSVLKRRWSKVIREVERQYASTLQSDKKKALDREITRLKAYTFTASLTKRPDARIILATARDVPTVLPYPTLYATTPLCHTELLELCNHITPGGLLVCYTDWPEIQTAFT